MNQNTSEFQKIPSYFLHKVQRKNTIRDGGSTALYAAYTVDTIYTVDMVYTVNMVYTIDFVYTFDMVYTVFMVYTVVVVYTIGMA